MKRLIVIGAGPMGLEAALAGVERGLAVIVLEKGQPGDALRRWGETRLFSPMVMNLSARARARVPVGDELMTGPEMAERVLRPLAQSLDVRLGHRVISVARARMRRDEFFGHPLRAERPFHVLVETPEGERRLEAEIVLDASGVYDNPIPLGVAGERQATLIRHLGALRDAHLAGRRVLLLGHGHSAAHALDHLVEIGAQVTWAVRAANARPVAEVACDPLAERARVAGRANTLAAAPPANLKVERRAHVEAITPDYVQLSGERRVTADVIVALTGYRPDLSILSELAVEIAPPTEGAARLYRAVSNVTDCLSVPKVSPADLDSGEPGFAMIGAKSYGRSRTFLLSTGLAQIETLLQKLA
jgi:thioredoxin reductase